MKSKIWVELIVSGFENHPNEITDIIGTQPSKISIKGEPYNSPSGKTIIEPFNEWILESGCNTSINMQEQMEKIISKIKPFSKEFLEFCNKHSPDFNIVIHVFEGEEYPYIGIDNSETLKDMAQLNATFGIDYTIYNNEDDL